MWLDEILAVVLERLVERGVEWLFDFVSNRWKQRKSGRAAGRKHQSRK
jgi:hypothetical protein